MKKIFLLFMLFGIEFQHFSFGQEGHELTPEQQRDKMVADKIWKPFVLTGNYQAFENKEIDFSALTEPVFVYVGQKSCVSCSYEFPTWIELAREHPEVNFVYITPDDSSVIQSKFGQYLEFHNLYVIQFPMDKLWDQNLAMVFPVKYFLDKTGTVVDAMSGGMIKDRGQLKQSWVDRLKKISVEDE